MGRVAWGVAILGLGFFGLTASAEPNCSRLNEEWQGRFYRDFNIQWELKAFQCPSSQSKIALAIFDLYMADIEGNFYEVAKTLVKKTTYNRFCEPRVLAEMRGWGQLSLCDGFFATSREMRVSTLFHEASHARSDDPGHTTCTQGADKGTASACDARFEEEIKKGSGYNWDVRLLRWLKHGRTFTDIDRAVAGSHLSWILYNRFNSITAEQAAAWSR